METLGPLLVRGTTWDGNIGGIGLESQRSPAEDEGASLLCHLGIAKHFTRRNTRPHLAQSAEDESLALIPVSDGGQLFIYHLDV
jgi:hypothetical protein